MGNQQTTRRVQFEREQTGLIAISDSVAKRLRDAGQPEKSQQPKEQAQNSSHHPAKVEGATRTELSVKTPKSETSGPPGKTVDPPITTRAPPILSPYTSSSFLPQSPRMPAFNSELKSQNSKLQEDNAKELTQLEEVWQDKYRRLENDTERIKQTSTEEFNRAVKDVEIMLESTRYFPPGRSELQKAVMDCYKENTSRSLNCSRQAESFIQSIDERKMGFLSKHVF